MTAPPPTTQVENVVIDVPPAFGLEEQTADEPVDEPPASIPNCYDGVAPAPLADPQVGVFLDSSFPSVYDPAFGIS